MPYISNISYDKGIVKEVNQDALGLRIIPSFIGDIVFAILCDGMGGISEGEVASSTVVKDFLAWFDDEIFTLIQSGVNNRLIEDVWRAKLAQLNERLYKYGRDNKVKVGTTASIYLGIGSQYYILNIGDSRVYEIGHEPRLLTKDHTYINREIEAGRMTIEEAEVHPKKHMLTECIGVTESFNYHFYQGMIKENHYYLLCSDGFRNKMSAEDMATHLFRDSIRNSAHIKNVLERLTNDCKNKGERDNISSIAFMKTDNVSVDDYDDGTTIPLELLHDLQKGYTDICLVDTEKTI